MSSNGKFALGAIVGAIAGAIAGVLTAPKSGKETRADIKAKANELKDQADVKAEEVKKQVDKGVADAKHTAEDYQDRATRAFDSAKKEFNKNK